MPAVATHPKSKLKRKARGISSGFASADIVTSLLRSLPSGVEANAMHLRFADRFEPDQLFQFCQDNPELRIEQTAEGDIIIMPPVGSEGGHRNFKLYLPFGVWHEQFERGKCFDATAGFTLPNGAMRSPDFAWISQERADKLTAEQWEKFAPVCPDFVVELRSRSDRLPTLQRKMAEYLENGARLGWLIDPLEKQVFIYRPGAPVERLENPATLSGEPVLAGFTLDLSRVW